MLFTSIEKYVKHIHVCIFHILYMKSTYIQETSSFNFQFLLFIRKLFLSLFQFDAVLKDTETLPSTFSHLFHTIVL